MDITLIGIFLEGLLSFLSPCVLPLLPLYMSYLVGENKTVDENGNIKYKTGRVFITTFFFVLGICFTLTLLAVSVNIISDFLDSYKEVISIICGTILITFGLHEIGIIHIDVLDFDTRFKVDLHLDKMNFLKAFLLGFIFSLGWSPCIGPMLTNALMLVANGEFGYLYIISYGLGLVIPFLLTGLITKTILNFINNKKNLFKWVLKIAGIIMICFGVYMIINAASTINNKSNVTTNSVSYFSDYEYIDQDGKKFNISDYKGKYIILNFTTTWCTYCKAEIPEMFDYISENKDVECIYVMSSLTSNTTKDNLINYINENLDFRVIVDEDNVLFNYCGISSFPTKFVISPEGELLGYVSGAMNKDGLANMIESAKQMND